MSNTKVAKQDWLLLQADLLFCKTSLQHCHCLVFSSTLSPTAAQTGSYRRHAESSYYIQLPYFTQKHHPCTNILILTTPGEFRNAWGLASGISYFLRETNLSGTCSAENPRDGSMCQIAVDTSLVGRYAAHMQTMHQLDTTDQLVWENNTLRCKMHIQRRKGQKWASSTRKIYLDYV